MRCMAYSGNWPNGDAPTQCFETANLVVDVVIGGKLVSLPICVLCAKAVGRRADRTMEFLVEDARKVERRYADEG